MKMGGGIAAGALMGGTFCFCVPVVINLSENNPCTTLLLSGFSCVTIAEDR
jgi:hypothetical protein